MIYIRLRCTTQVHEAGAGLSVGESSISKSSAQLGMYGMMKENDALSNQLLHRLSDVRMPADDAETLTLSHARRLDSALCSVESVSRPQTHANTRLARQQARRQQRGG